MTAFILAALLRSVVTAAIALASWWILRRQSAALRHWVLAAGIVASAVVVPLSLVMPRWSVMPAIGAVGGFENQTRPTSEVVEASDVSGQTRRTSAGGFTNQTRPTSEFVVAVWAGGALIGLGLLVTRLRRLARLTTRAMPMVGGPWSEVAEETRLQFAIDRPVSLRRTIEPHIVATWGVRSPVILLPSSAGHWDASWIRVVLRHELAHIRRYDWPIQMAGELLRAVLWINPLMWALCARLRRESECACDDLVISSGTPIETYASHLIDIARLCRASSSSLPALPVAGASTLERRITMLLNTKRDRRLPSIWTVSVILAGMLAIGGMAASVGLSAQTTTGRLVGHVYDSSGAVLPAVEVVLEDEQKTKWPTMTDSSGAFEFTPVGAGKYTLRATLAGFRSLSDQFELRNPKDWTRTVTLQVGELEETISVTARRPAPRSATSATAASEPVRIGGNIKPPVKLVNVPPVYPAAMRDAGLEGVVPMEAVIAEDGTVASVRGLSAQVHPEFARAAENAVRQWRFSQTLLNGVAVEVRMAVSVHFSLTD